MSKELNLTLTRNLVHLGPSAKLHLIGMYILRNVRMWLRFPLSFFMDIIYNLSGAATFVFIGIALVKSPTAVGVGNDYTTYVILGLMLTSLTSAGLNGPYQSLSESYWFAQLESILLSPAPVSMRIIGDVIWQILQAIFKSSIYLLLGIIFGISINPEANLLLLALFLLAAPLSVLGLGLIAASTFMLLNAKGWSDPIRWMVFTFEGLATGLYFPVAVLPVGIRWLSYCLPQTYLLDGIRTILLPDYKSSLVSAQGYGNIGFDLMILLGFIVIVIPIGLFMLRLGLAKAKRDGCLSRWA